MKQNLKKQINVEKQLSKDVKKELQVVEQMILNLKKQENDIKAIEEKGLFKILIISELKKCQTDLKRQIESQK